jgi:DMSO/TMAO reductase YedYZ molybdopterin-dependent catalytic subunit
MVVMECAGNGCASMNPPIKGTPWNLGAISVANFSGIGLHQILELAGYSENGCEVLFTGADQGVIRSGEIEPYARSLPLEVALLEDTILAWQMNGEPLPIQHGFPLPLVVPGWYGMAAVKWLREITVQTKPFEGFFQTKEYVYSGEKGIADNTPVTSIQVRSVILEPEDGYELSMDTIQVSGIASTGNGTVTRVEPSFDDGNKWTEAAIDPPTSSNSASRWQYLWRPESSGQYTITARAYDSEGNVQPLTPRWNRGGYGNNAVHQITVSIT